MLKKFYAAVLLTAAFTAAPASAIDFDMASGWSGEASLNGGKTTGNTKTEDFGLGLHLQKEDDLWRHKFDATTDYGKVDGTKNKSRWGLGYQIDRDVSERLYVYGNADYFKDNFGAYKDGYFLGTGLGYKAILPEPLSWNLEGGAGYRAQKARGYQTDPADPTTAVNPKRAKELALRGFSDLDWGLNESVSLYNDTEILWSDSDTYIWNEAGIKANLAGNLSAFASYRVDNHSDVSPGTKKTDSTTRFGLIYTIN